MKQYISAQMNIVRLGNDIIVTSPQLNLSNGGDTDDPDDWGGMDAPSRRYRNDYDF